MRLLYLQTSAEPPPFDSSIDRFILLSEKLEGDVLQPDLVQRGGPGGKSLRAGLLAGLYTGAVFATTGRAHGAGRERAAFSTPFGSISRKHRRVHREQPFDCVMVYSHMTTALCGILIKWLTGAKLVVEVSSSPDLLYVNDRPHPRLVDRLRRIYSDVCLHLSMWACDTVHLLYADALDAYPLVRNVRRAVFHEFVPVSVVPRHESAGDPYILLVGAPWYLKGADLLVEAFRRLASDFPRVGLKIMGHFPDKDQLEALTGGDGRIEILRAHPYKDTLWMISQASVFVLPSRCEGMGRVLLEAMAAGVPVIGANVGGIPSLVRDGENGFLFPSGDVTALEARLRQLLSNPALCESMGARGYEMAHGEFSEEVYVDRFVTMIETAVRKT